MNKEPLAIDRAETAHSSAKTRNFEQLTETDPEIRKHLIFSSLSRKFLIDNSTSLCSQTLPYLRLLDDVILRSFCSVSKIFSHIWLGLNITFLPRSIDADQTRVHQRCRITTEARPVLKILFLPL